MKFPSLILVVLLVFFAGTHAENTRELDPISRMAANALTKKLAGTYWTYTWPDKICWFRLNANGTTTVSWHNLTGKWEAIGDLTIRAQITNDDVSHNKYSSFIHFNPELTKGGSGMDRIFSPTPEMVAKIPVPSGAVSTPSKTPIPSNGSRLTQTKAEIIKLLTSGSWYYSGKNWSQTTSFNGDGTMGDKRDGTWKLTNDRILITGGDHPERVTTLLLPLDSKETKCIDFRGLPFTASQDSRERDALSSSTPEIPNYLGITPELQESAAAIVKANHNNLVFVTGKEGQGSGFIANVGGANYLITNAHVAAGISGATFKSLDNTVVQGGKATVAVGEDIFRMEMPADGTPLEAMDGVDANAGIGDDVVVLGNAEGAGVINTITGKIVGIGPNLVEINAPFVPGNSGSPIIHIKTGKVIGVATYTVTQKYDATTKEKMKAPVVRRFGYRLDSVKTWQPVNWQTFHAQAVEMGNIETLTKDLDDFFRDITENNGRVTPSRHTNPVIKTRIDQWLANKSTRLSPSDKAFQDNNFISFLKIACLTDISVATRHMSYDYFQRDLADERATRTEMAKAFEEIIKNNR